MTELFEDIETLESALVALSEGASDEKYAAVWNLEKLLLKKKSQARKYEKDLEDLFNNIPV